jgi:hypothetical protein
MRQDELSRRDFHRLSAAAFGGIIAGLSAGCGDEGSTPVAKPLAAPSSPSTVKAPVPAPSEPKSADAKAPAVAATAVALHACRGLNECKGQGKDHKNACVGQGNCFTTKHECSGQNDCKYQGGCGDTYGINDCKGQGGCGHLPIPAKPWKKAREAFEVRMVKAGKKVGKAPEPAKT